MKGQWIIHEQGADKICAVADRLFETRRCYWADRFPDHGLNSFQPWMSRPAFGEEVLQHTGDRYELYAKSKHLLLSGNKRISLSREPWAEHQIAYDALVNSRSWLSRLARKLILEIVPIQIDGKPYEGLGGLSEPALIGLIFMGRMLGPFARVKAILGMAHELGHQALMVLQTIENMAGEHRDALVYSGVRGVERPFLAALHAAVALAYMLEAGDLLLAQEEWDAAEREYILDLRNQHQEGLNKGYRALAKFTVPPICKEVLVDLRKLTT